MRILKQTFPLSAGPALATAGSWKHAHAVGVLPASNRTRVPLTNPGGDGVLLETLAAPFTYWPDPGISIVPEKAAAPAVPSRRMALSGV
jgi:hypothetical protein